jgi:predicted aconitase with swiveling domain
MKLRLKGRGCSSGVVKGEAIVSERPFGFWQGIDPKTGVVIDQRHDLFGESITGKVFVFPYGRGSTGTPGIFIEAVRNRVAPAGIINLNSEPMIIVCALLAEEFYGVKIPIVDGFELDHLKEIRTGDRVEINGESGEIKIL